MVILYNYIDRMKRKMWICWIAYMLSVKSGKVKGVEELNPHLFTNKFIISKTKKERNSSIKMLL